MPTAADVRRLALLLPEATEQDHHGFPSFRVGGKIFATLPDADHANVMLDHDDILDAVALDPAACAEQWWGKQLAAVRVSLASIGEDVLQQLLAEAWARKAPKRLRDRG